MWVSVAPGRELHVLAGRNVQRAQPERPCFGVFLMPRSAAIPQMDPRIGRAETPRVLLDNVKTAAPNKRETRKPRTQKLPQGSRKKRGKHGFLGVGGLELSSVGAAERFLYAIPPWKTEKSLDHKKNKEARQYGSCPARRCLARNRRRSDPRSIADLGTDPGVRGAGCHRGCEGLGLFYANAHPLPFGLRQQATHLSAVVSLHRITSPVSTLPNLATPLN